MPLYSKESFFTFNSRVRLQRVWPTYDSLFFGSGKSGYPSGPLLDPGPEMIGASSRLNRFTSKNEHFSSETYGIKSY